MGYKKKLIKTFNKIHLRDFPHVLARIETKIYMLIKQGESNSKTLKRLKYKRNIIRFVLLNKLLKWKSDPDSARDWTYAEIMENESRKPK